VTVFEDAVERFLQDEGEVDDRDILEAFQLYRLCCATGFRPDVLVEMDYVTVETMRTMELTRRKYFLGRLKKLSEGKQKSAEVLMVSYLSLLAEEKFFL
jgi:hypothetical protein